MNYYIEDNFDKVKELKDKYNKVAIIWDERINSKIVSEIGNTFNDCIALSVEGKDKCKTIETYKMVLSHLVSFNLDRKDLIIGIGGGSTLDLAGFVAATYLRGVDLIYIPTTVISMVDASIGGKNGINIDGIKNMAGTFYEPEFFLVNISVLDDLSDKEFKSGVSEIIKMASIFDEDLFNELLNKPLYKNREDKEYIKHVLDRAIELKFSAVEEDFKDFGVRRVLNFGHTFGHAIESASNFMISHGDAISIGMVLETSFFKNDIVLEKLKECLKANGLPTVSTLDRKTIIKDIKYDKKRNKEYITLPVLDEIGRFHFEDVKISDLV